MNEDIANIICISWVEIVKKYEQITRVGEHLLQFISLTKGSLLHKMQIHVRDKDLSDQKTLQTIPFFSFALMEFNVVKI